MKPEIEDLIEIYGNKERYMQRIEEAIHLAPIPDIAEARNLQAKIQFGKDRQRGELLKQNKVFLNELEQIKNRLGEKFFKLLDSLADNLEQYGDILSKADVAEPIILLAAWLPSEHSEFPEVFYYLPGTRKDNDGRPESIVKPGKDPLFDGLPLEWIILDEKEFHPEKMGTAKFIALRKIEVFYKYWGGWSRFLEKWHISTNWDGDLQCLHVHSLPTLIVELDRDHHNLPVVIRLGAWATTDDIQRAWPRVKEIMKEARIFRERESDNFLRDYIWYQLNKKDAMSPLSIARFWAEKFPKEIDLKIVEEITKNEDTFEKVPLEKRLEEVLSGDLQMAELKGRFIEDRKAFIKTGLKDKVKKSIKKIEEKIKRLGSEDWDRNRLKLLGPLR